MEDLLKEFNKIYLEINGEKLDSDIKSYMKNFFADEIPFIDFVTEFNLDINDSTSIISFILNVSNFDKLQRFGYKYHKKETN